MDPLVIVAKLQKLIQDNLQRVGDTMFSGGIVNMEKLELSLQTFGATLNGFLEVVRMGILIVIMNVLLGALEQALKGLKEHI